MRAHEILGMIVGDTSDGIVEFSYKFSKDEIKKYYRPTVRQMFPGGFRDIRRVPDFMILSKLKQHAVIDAELGKIVLQTWFNKNEKLYNTISEILEKKEYEINTPDFEKNDISWKQLKDEDVRHERTAFFFAPDGKDIEGIEPIEATVMAALLGWSGNES